VYYAISLHTMKGWRVVTAAAVLRPCPPARNGSS
jgi:hypothetical protein